MAMICWLAVAPLAAGDDPLVRLLGQLKNNYDPAHSVSAQYELTIYWSVREKEERRQGSIVLANQDRFRITAGDETFVSDGETYWHHSSKAKQVVIKNLADVDRSLLPSRVFTRFVVSCPFTLKERLGGIAELFWTADSADAPYRSVHVRAREKDGVIVQCILTDRQDNRFTYSFSGTTIGKKFPGSTFEFSIPKNAHVVDTRT